MNTATSDLTYLDVRPIPCREKHAKIFRHWDSLAVGEHFVLVNDHDPVPLRYQFAAQYPDAFSWEYLASGPEEFQVKITRLRSSNAALEVAPCSGSPADSADVFDVRAIPCRVKHAQIFQRWFDLAAGSSFVLVNDHDPVPLRYQFEAEFPDAFSWEYLQPEADEFRVRITKLAAVPTPAAAPDRASAVDSTRDGIQQIDARGFEPPEPLIRILDALESLPAGNTLRAITDREPCHLFGEAAQRGFTHQCQEQPDGSWVTLLRRS